jgi:PAS domain S-box-containing protein
MLLATRKWLFNLWNKITEPVDRVQDVRQRSQSKLLASLLAGSLIVGLPISLIPVLIYPTEYWARIHTLNGFVSLGIVIFAYWLSRQGRYRLAVHCMAVLGTLSISGLSVVAGGVMGMRMLYYLTLIIIFSNMFLSARMTLVYAGAHLLLVLLYGVLDPTVIFNEVLLGPFVFLVTITALLFLIVYHRERLDQSLQADLVESRERYRIISEMISDYAFALRVEPDGMLTQEWITDSFTRLTGYSSEDIKHLAPRSVYHPEDQPLVISHLDAVMKGEERSDEYRMILKGGHERWMRLSRRPVWDDAHQRVIRIYGVAQDVTDEKFAAQQKFDIALAEARFDLVHRFFRAVSHDFRTSLSIIETNRYLIQRLLERNEQADIPCRLEYISEQVVRLTRQLENLKIASSLNSPVTELCDLNQLAKSELETFRGEMERKQLELTVETDPTMPTVRANSDELLYAVGHLLDNALHFTPTEGKVCLRVTHDGDTAQIAVQDTGVGIEAEDLEHIFDFFYRVDKARSIESGGIGLGLSIAKMVAEAYGGKITAESTPGKGSTFTMSFPMAKGHHANTAVAQ